MKIIVTRTDEVADDVTEELLSNFADWLDDHELLRDGLGDASFSYTNNRELGKKFIADWNSVVR